MRPWFVRNRPIKSKYLFDAVFLLDDFRDRVQTRVQKFYDYKTRFQIRFVFVDLVLSEHLFNLCVWTVVVVSFNSGTTGDTSGAEIANFSEHMSLSQVSSVIHVAGSVVFCVVYNCLSYCLFLIAIVLSFLLQFTSFYYAFVIVKLFLLVSSYNLNLL